MPDELLSGWLSRLAASNHCEVADLLNHIGIGGKHAAALDHDINMLAADRISVAARIDPAFVLSMTFAAMQEAEMRLTAQVPFQTCPNCADGGLELRHWRRAWAFDCQMCGDRLLPKADKQKGAVVSEKLVNRARNGARVLERVAMSGSARELRRAMRAVTFAMGLNALRGDPFFALQSPRSNIRLFCLAAVVSAQSRPLVKAALCSMDIDVYSRVALLRAYDKEPGCLQRSTRLLSGCDYASVVQPPHLIFKSKKGRKTRRVSDLGATRHHTQWSSSWRAFEASSAVCVHPL